MRHRLPMWAVALCLAAWSACGPIDQSGTPGGLVERTGTLLPAARPTESVSLLRAHAHNDYLHIRPLYDALDHGFTSVEADIYLVNGELLVAHEEVDLRPGRTLQSLYLKPLRERISQNGGRVYRERPQFSLLIDIKSEAEATYAILSRELKAYADILTTFGAHARPGPVMAIISGNRPRETMENEDARYAAYDGRLEDLGSGVSTDFIPLISGRWGASFTWNGVGPMPEEEQLLLKHIVDAAHAEGRRLRFWGTPDRPGTAREALWRAVAEAGVDLINTDDLAGLQRFLLEYKPDSPKE